MKVWYLNCKKCEGSGVYSSFSSAKLGAFTICQNHGFTNVRFKPASPVYPMDEWAEVSFDPIKIGTKKISLPPFEILCYELDKNNVV